MLGGGAVSLACFALLFARENIPDLDDVVSVCAGLVIVYKASNNIRLVRYTTQEFFKTIRNTCILTVQQEIAATCLTYLSFKSFRSGSCHNDKEFEERCDKNFFLDYAARYWGRHAETVQKQVFELTSKFIQNNNLLSCAVQKMSISSPKHKWTDCSQQFPKGTTGLQLTAIFGLPYLLKKQIRE
jgi:hypothetical protein